MRTTGTTGVRAGILLIACGLLVLQFLNNQGPDSPAKTPSPAKAGIVEQEIGKTSVDLSGPGKRAVAHDVMAVGPAREGPDPESAWGQRFQTFPEPPLADDEMVGEYTVAEHRQFKEEYYCDLAVQAREQCEGLQDTRAYEHCLSLRSYYTYGRHCEYLP